MKINKDNYETYFLDYSEGNLSEEQVVALYSFVDQYPDLKAELHAFEQIKLDDIQSVFPDKNLLKKNISTQLFSSEDFIAYHEGDLDSATRRKVAEYILSNAAAKKEFDQLAKMYLSPDKSILYSDKTSLIKETELYTTDNFIAYHEGDLSEERKRDILAAVGSSNKLKKEFDQYAKLQLVADASIVYEDKKSLKKKEATIIAMYWRHIAVAASLLLMVSFYFLNKNDIPEVGLASDDNPTEEMKIEDEKIEQIKSIDEPVENKLVEDVGSGNKNNIAVEKRQVAMDRTIISSADEAAVKLENTEIILSDDSPIIRNERGAGTQKLGYPSMLKPMNISLENYTAIELPTTLENKDALNFHPVMPKENMAQTKENNKKAITLLAFAEKKAAQAISGGKKDELKLFDVFQRVGDKTRLYNLKEKEGNKFSLKVASIEMTGKRKEEKL